MGGLAAVMAAFPAGHAYAPVTSADTKCFEDFVNYTQQQGLTLEVPAVGATWQLGQRHRPAAGPGGPV